MLLRIVNSNNLHFAAIAALALLLFATSAKAAPMVSNGWIRLLPEGLPAAGYFDLHNSGNRPILLLAASSPACGMLMLHKSQNIGGMTRMIDVARIEVAPGATLSFTPNGYHLMCMDPNPALKPGARVPVTLAFGDGRKTTSAFVVRNAVGK